MEDLIEAYLSVYNDINEKRLFPGAPDHAHSFPLSPEERKIAQGLGIYADKLQREIDRVTNRTPTQKSAAKRKPTTNLKDVKIGESYDSYDLVLSHLLDEGYCDSHDSAIKMMAAMSQDWINNIISEAPFQISGPHPTTIDGTKLDYSPSNVGKPYQNKKRAQTRADKMNQDHGASVYRVTKVD